MSIASEISRLQTAKADLKTAIEGKGVTVSADAKLDAYPALVESISGGSIEDLITKENLVRIIINVDGTDSTLDASNNFSDTTLAITMAVRYIKFYFNDLEIDTSPIGPSSMPTADLTYNFLGVGSKIFGLKRVGRNIYIYLNNVQIGHVFCDD